MAATTTTPAQWRAQARTHLDLALTIEQMNAPTLTSPATTAITAVIDHIYNNGPTPTYTNTNPLSTVEDSMKYALKAWRFLMNGDWNAEADLVSEMGEKVWGERVWGEGLVEYVANF